MASKATWIALAAALLAFGNQAAATTVFEAQFVCPVGGEKFKGYEIGSYTSWGQRPDGRSYGTLPVYPLQECPTNGFVIFDKKITPEEIAVLVDAVATPEYQAMRATETPHYRAWWLMSKIRRDSYSLAWQLLQASWETDGNFERKARYQAAFVAVATGLDRAGEHTKQWPWYQSRAANALRELGHFDKAATVLGRADKPELMPTDPEEAKHARDFFDGLRTLIAEQNPASEPANLIPNQQAAWRCEIAVPLLTAVEQAVCAKPDMAKLRTDARAAIDKENQRRAKEAARSAKQQDKD